ncbi:hypothetical protein [Thermus caldifontis]|uniref:hypothetical protein n=1 Tax=Thermus caldifontis TaxID=1930763 RepID=UPI000DF1BAB6|nr:hypothetical protein [Thermus caldifontis]
MRKLAALMVLLAGLALAQATDNHTVTVQIPSILSLQLDATDYLFDFTDASLNGTETVTVGNTTYTKASLAAYNTFIDTATSTQDFAPTSLTGTGGQDYGTLTIRTNRAQWTVAPSVSGTLTLGNNRVKVFAEKVSGKGSSGTTVPTSITSVSTLISAGSGGQGKSVYRLYYLFTMDINDDIPLSGINNEQITITYTLSSP